MARAKDKTREIAAGQGERNAKREEGRRQQEGPGERKMVHVTRLSSLSSSGSFAFPVRASPITTRCCSPTVGRFTYKFNKHISYLMHALSRECFDRPGPSFSSSTRSSVQHLAPHLARLPARKLSLWLIVHYLLLGFTFPDGSTGG